MLKTHRGWFATTSVRGLQCILDILNEYDNRHYLKQPCLHIAIPDTAREQISITKRMFPLLMKSAATHMATRGQHMPYTTGHNRYFSIKYSNKTYVPKVFLYPRKTP